MPGIRIRLLLAASTAMLIVPTTASAATQLGSTFVPVSNCGTNTTYIQTVSSGPSYSAPYSGVITSWSFQPGVTMPTTIKLKVGRTTPGADLTNDTSITIVGESAPQTPTGTGLNTFSTRIPVQAGDDIGIYTNAAVLTVNSCNFDNAYTDHYGDGDIAPGTTETFKEESFQHDVSAVLEPDCNHNGLGDETQEKNVSGPGCPATGRRAAALKKCKKKKSKQARAKCRKKAKKLPV